MAAIRGTNSNHPCPHCLVANESLCDMTLKSTLWTSEAVEAVYKLVVHAKADAREIALKAVGLRPVEVSFISIGYYHMAVQLTEAL